MLIRYLGCLALIPAAATVVRAQPTATASTAADLALSGPVFGVVANELGVVASQPGQVVWLSTDGRVLRRPLPQPTRDDGPAAGRASAQALADQALFDRHGIDEEVRHEVEGERWLEDMRSQRSGSAEYLEASIEQPPLIAANSRTTFAAGAAGLFELLGTGSLNKVLAWQHQPHALAVSANGNVAYATSAGVSVFGPPNGGTSAVCAPLAQAEQIALFDQPKRKHSSDDPCAQTTLLWRQDQTIMVQSPGDDGERKLAWHASSLVGCGNFALVNASEGVFLLLPARALGQVVTARRLGEPAPQGQLRCTPHLPWAMAAVSQTGDGTNLSSNGGKDWVPLTGGTNVTDVTFTDEGAWLATPWGLLRPGDGAVQTHAPTRFAQPLPHRPWQTWLPTVDLAATVAQRTQASTSTTPLLTAQERHETSLWLTAEFPLTPKPPAAPVPQFASFENDARNEPSQPAVTPPQPRLRAVAKPSATQLVPQPPPSCLADLRDAATRLAMADPLRLRSLVARARNAAWLPELRFRVEKRLGRNQSIDFDSDTIFAPLGIRTVNDMRLEVRASWDLARVVYSPDELAATVQAARIAEARREVAVLVNRLFFERRRREQAERAAAEAGESGEDDEFDLEEDEKAPRSTRRQRLRANSNLQSLRTAELSADLDALTGGLAATCR